MAGDALTELIEENVSLLVEIRGVTLAFFICSYLNLSFFECFLDSRRVVCRDGLWTGWRDAELVESLNPWGVDRYFCQVTPSIGKELERRKVAAFHLERSKLSEENVAENWDISCTNLKCTFDWSDRWRKFIAQRGNVWNELLTPSNQYLPRL